MNFKYIEELVTKCKNGDMLSKEKLAEEFRPLIFNISKRTFIDGYEIHDMKYMIFKINVMKHYLNVFPYTI